MKFFGLALAAVKDPSKLAEAQQLQRVIGRADFTIARASVSGTKALLEKLYGYGEILGDLYHTLMQRARKRCGSTLTFRNF